MLHFLPVEDQEARNEEVLDRIKQQNAALASELNSTLARRQDAKEAELSLDRNRGLNERLAAAEQRAAELEQEGPVNLARITQLQSDLDLAKARLERLVTEFSHRDMKIMELEMLLNEAGNEAFQMNLPLSLEQPTFGSLLSLPPAPAPASSSPSVPTETSPSVDALKVTQAQAEQAYKDRNYALAEILFQRGRASGTEQQSGPVGSGSGSVGTRQAGGRPEKHPGSDPFPAE